jgi:hypothetical protein
MLEQPPGEQDPAVADEFEWRSRQAAGAAVGVEFLPAVEVGIHGAARGREKRAGRHSTLHQE